MNSEEQYFMQLQTLEQEANHLGEQIKIIDQQISELNSLKKNLEHIKNSGEEEIYSELSKGIFVKSIIKKSNLLVEVGGGVFVPKNFDEINEIIDDQNRKFEEVKIEISERIESINNELNNIIKKINTKEPDKKEAKKK